jgi:hypothetical protein
MLRKSFFFYLDNLPRNPYFVCRAFWNEEPITSVVCWGSSTPKFNFEQVSKIAISNSSIRIFSLLENSVVTNQIYARKNASKLCHY